MRVLVIGDTHIPRRAASLPKQVSEFIESQSYDFVVCTGDLTGEEVLNYLKGLGERLSVVRGNMDHLNLPEYEILELDEIVAGVIHGDQVYPRGNREQLIKVARKLGVDVLISGHTHSPDVYLKGVLLLNPGSATGVWSGGNASLKPSFMVLSVEGRSIGVELYELEKDLKCTSKRFDFR